jgi:hypothetical protein
VSSYARSCATNHPDLADACCHLDSYLTGTTYSSGSYYSRLLSTNVILVCVDYPVFACSICGETNPDNTVEALKKQADVDYITPRLQAMACFGGSVAEAPGSGVSTLRDFEKYVEDIKNSKCSINFSTTSMNKWTEWGSCNAQNQQSKAYTCPTSTVSINGGQSCIGTMNDTRTCVSADDNLNADTCFTSVFKYFELCSLSSVSQIVIFVVIIGFIGSALCIAGWFMTQLLCPSQKVHPQQQQSIVIQPSVPAINIINNNNNSFQPNTNVTPNIQVSPVMNNHVDTQQTHATQQETIKNNIETESVEIV